MAILTGRYGQVKWDQAGVTAVPIISLNAWQGDFSTEHEDVTCFQDTNRVYIPGMRDISGSLTGFWNSDDMSLIEATALTSPGTLDLIPHSNDPSAATPHKFSGLAYMDAELDTDVEGAPALSGTFMAAGPWTLPAAAMARLETLQADRDRAA